MLEHDFLAAQASDPELTELELTYPAQVSTLLSAPLLAGLK